MSNENSCRLQLYELGSADHSSDSVVSHCATSYVVGDMQSCVTMFSPFV